MAIKIQKGKIYFQKLNKLESTPESEEKQELFMWQKLYSLIDKV
jgi:hypothetical protein